MLFSKPILSNSKVKIIKKNKDEMTNLNMKIIDDRNSLNSFSANDHKSKEEIIKDLYGSPIINRVKDNFIVKQHKIFQNSPNNIYNDFVQKIMRKKNSSVRSK